MLFSMRPGRSYQAGIEDLGKGLNGLGVTIISTGGTAKKLREVGCEVADVADITEWPEMLGELLLFALIFIVFQPYNVGRTAAQQLLAPSC
jgi:hypothetical protein